MPMFAEFIVTTNEINNMMVSKNMIRSLFPSVSARRGEGTCHQQMIEYENGEFACFLQFGV
jgi:hypothetical protein